MVDLHDDETVEDLQLKGEKILKEYAERIYGKTWTTVKILLVITTVMKFAIFIMVGMRVLAG